MNETAVSILISLYHCEEFLASFFYHTEKITNKETYEFLLLHNEPTEKELEIIQQHISGKPYYKHIIIPQRERLYQTWNRGIRLSQSEYLTIWNVDDIRFPKSIEWQKKALDEHSDAMVAYGDMWVSTQYGSQGNILTIAPEWTKKNQQEFCRSYHMSCFQMWRKSIHEKIGYYDEQFWCSADFDFQVRAAIHFPFIKIPEPLGIYLEGLPHKISSNGKQQLENNIIYNRYGVWDKINLLTLSNSKSKYDKDQLLFFGNWKQFAEKQPFGWLYKTKGVLIAVAWLPMHILRSWKSKILKKK